MDTLFVLLMIIFKIVHILVHPLYIFLARGKKRVVSPIKNDLLRISATDLADKIRKKELTSEEICLTYIERIKAVNPLINAIVEERFDAAIKEAKRVDQNLKTSSLNETELRATKPLLGVPVTVKESCSVEGMPLTGGLMDRIHCRSDVDGDAVAKLRSAGAIILLVSNTPELCAFFETNNYVTGKTNNPYDTTCTSGGSSGGEAALVGAGASVIGLGSDIAGSIRLPAAYNGIFGHKPTPKITSIKGHYPISPDKKFAEYFVVGPMARYAKDLRLMMNVLIEPQHKLKLRINEQVEMKSLKVFFKDSMDCWYVPTLQREIQLGVQKAAAHLEQLGATLADYKFPELSNACHVGAKQLFALKDMPDILKGMYTFGELEFVKSLLRYSKYTPDVVFSLVLQRRPFDYLVDDHRIDIAKWRKDIEMNLGNNGILLCPTTSTSAHKHHEGFFLIPNTVYLVIANVLGLPATNVPCGFDRHGMPFGIQVIAGPNQDRLCLAVAEELEKYFGGWREPQ